LFYYLRRLTNSEQDAWDLLQQTWLAVLKGLGSLKDPGCLPSWLYRIAHNTAKSRLRRAYTERKIVVECPDASEIAGEEAEFGFEDIRSVHKALAKLSMPQREVLTLFFLEDFSMEEISGILGLPTGTVKSRLHYAKSNIKKIIKGDRRDNE